MGAAPPISLIPPTAGVGDFPLTKTVWALFLIAQLNATGNKIPYTFNNVNNIQRWMTAEEPSSSWWHANNPLNINASGAGFDTFPNLSQAATSTANLIASGYPGILKALQQDASPALFSAAVVTSPWAGGRYGVAAAGAPSQYIVAGRGLDYIATLSPDSSGGASPGTVAKTLPADAGAVIPANPFPGPLGAVAGLATGGTSVPNIPIIGWADALGTLLSDLISANWWKRVGIFSLGVVLIAGGVALFISTTKTGQRVESEAVQAGEVAAVA